MCHVYPFNEDTRLKSTIYKAQSLTKVLGADAIYATNNNRTFVIKKSYN